MFRFLPYLNSVYGTLPYLTLLYRANPLLCHVLDIRSLLVMATWSLLVTANHFLVNVTYY